MKIDLTTENKIKLKIYFLNFKRKRMKEEGLMKILVVLFLSVFTTNLFGKDGATADSLCTHKIIRGNKGEILSWYKPEQMGAGYSHVVNLASGFLKNDVPAEPETGFKLYYLFCEFQGPEYNKDFYKGITGRKTLPHNPACVFAGFTESLAVKYRIYSGDETYLELVRKCLDHMLKNGTTPSSWVWGNCPYASSFAGDTIYSGTGFWEIGRGDGQYVIEPDKVGEMGLAYLQFYEITEESVYLEAACNCAGALAKNAREGSYSQSPWPFRVQARLGDILEQYCSNVLSPVKLFDELIRIKEQANIDKENIEAYKKARDMAWNWMFSTKGPMKTYVWKGYFEDVPCDNNNENRVQVTPIEVARYLIQHPELDSNYKQNIPALIGWCDGVFGTDGARGYNAQCEQLMCFQPMGSHTARYASVCAMWYALKKNEWYKTEAYENFNWATYCTSKKGVVSVGTSWSGSWFSDGYGDYIKHFIDGMAAIPEWAPADENHLLGSTSVVQQISYGNENINYKTYLPVSTEVLRLTNIPREITVDGIIVQRKANLESNGWTWEKLNEGGILRIVHSSGKEVKISL